MGQRLARKEMEDGLALYNQQDFEAAIRKWKRGLHRIKHRGDRFTTLGYLASVHCDCGKYRDMLAYANMQIDLANDTDSEQMRAEAYLCLARSNERLCDYHKAVSYSRMCLQNKPRDIRIHGYVFLCQANAYVGFGFYTNALENLEKCMRVSKDCNDPALELHVFLTMGSIFVTLKDYEKGVGFHLKAAELAKNLKVSELSTRYQRLAYYHLAVPLYELGRLEEAYCCCQDALRMAVEEGDKPTQARCMKIMGDLERRDDQFELSMESFEGAASILTEVGDRAGQVEVMLGQAETLHYMDRHDSALEKINKAIELAQHIGAKMLLRKSHRLMMDVYRCLGDEDVAKEQQDICCELLDELLLFCALCGRSYADNAQSLEPLSCFHIVHSVCIGQSESTEFSPALIEEASKKCNRCYEDTNKLNRSSPINEDLTKTGDCVSE